MTERMIERRFNHDLLIASEDQNSAKERWPVIAGSLIDVELLEEFGPHEEQAKRYKKRVQWVGTVSVLLMVAALVGATLSLPNWQSSSAGATSIRGMALEFCALVGLILALLASRFGPYRRRWLKHRFLTECYRRWHFRSMTSGGHSGGLQFPVSGDQSDDTPAGRGFKNLVQELDGSVGQKMDALRDEGKDPLGEPVRTWLPTDPTAKHQLLQAFKVLRIDHQLDYSAYKISADDKTFLGLSITAWIGLTELLAGASLFLALAFSVTQIFHREAWMSLAAVLLAIVGVGVRAWRDGMGLIQERESYDEMHHRLEILEDRWRQAKTDDQLAELMEQVDEIALEELRTFLAAHDRAQFLF